MDNIQLIPLVDNMRKDRVKAKNGMCECFSCKKTKTLNMFVKSNRGTTGYTTICLECERNRRKTNGSK